eukprot:Gb_17133 [translate_table: standard]
MTAQNLELLEVGKDMDTQKPVKPPRNKYVIACSVLASMNSIILGYDVGVMSGAVIFIKEDLKITNTKVEVLIGSLNIISLLGAGLAGRTSDAIGRRWTMALAALIFMLGALVMSLAPSFALLMVGRLVAGIGVGFALLIAPVYTAEVSPASSRGALTCFPEIFINVGILLGYISNYAFSGLPAHLSWRLMVGMGVVPPIFLGLGVLTMPESPRWLVMRNRNDEAMTVLVKTSDSRAEAAARLSEIVEGIEYARQKANNPGGSNMDIDPLKSRGEGTWREIFKPSPTVRRMLMIALGVQFFQQASGIDATVYYSPFIFKKAGINSQTGILIATIAVGFTKAGFVVVAAFLIDKVGRRPLLLTSAIGTTLSLLTLSLALLFVGKTSGIGHHVAAFLAIIAACSNVGFFSIGLGPVNWVLGSEIFPLRLRAKASSLGVGVNRVVSGVVSMSFLSLAKAMTEAGVFFLYAGISFLCAVFFYACIPETKGKTLEEIVAYFHKQSDSEKISRAPGELELGNGQPIASKAMTTPAMEPTQLPETTKAVGSDIVL